MSDAFGQIARSVSSLEVQMSRVRSEVAQVNQGVAYAQHAIEKTQSEVAALTSLVAAFIDSDRKAKELQLSETRIIQVRQELDSKYGHYRDVRRRITGILQAQDLRLVRAETIANVSEELMLSAPRYWLAPCLVYLSARHSENPDLEERALNEALRRDTAKMTLFLALLFRRFGDFDNSTVWLNRYLASQNPFELSRVAVILIDGIMRGAFGEGTLASCKDGLDQWMATLQAKPGYDEEQVTLWESIIRAKNSDRSTSAYGKLKTHLTNWSELEHVLLEARAHRHFAAYIGDTLGAEDVLEDNFTDEVDNLLDRLVTDFDEDEAPLRRQERLLSLIIQHEGDKAAAQQAFELEEKGLSEVVNFGDLLGGIVLNPSASGASIATQQFALLFSRGLIHRAHTQFTERYRQATPTTFQLKIDGWSESVSGPEDLQRATESRTAFLTQQLAHELRAAAMKRLEIVATGAALTAMVVVFAMTAYSLELWNLHLLSGAAMSVITVAFLARVAYVFNKRKTIKAKFDSVLSYVEEDLRAILKQIGLWFAEYEAEDSNAHLVQTAVSSHDAAQGVMRPQHLTA